MALSQEARDRLIIALTSRPVGKEVADYIDDIHIAAPASHVALLGATTNVPVSNVTLSTGDTYTDAAVKAAIDSAVNASRVAIEARLDAIEAKVDAALLALQVAGLMS